MPETRARDIADLGGDATSLATDAELSSGLALKADTTALAPKVDYELTANAQNGSGGSAYTFVLADARRLTAATNAAAKTFTIPPQSSVAWADNSIIRVVNYGAGVLTIAGGSGVTVTNAAKTLAQYESAAVIRTGSNAWTLVPFSGGVGNADFSNAATGTYSSGGFNYKYVTFTASGTLTVTKAGFADVLVVGGGGGGGTGHPSEGEGGGGAGGMYSYTDLYLPADVLNVTVGGGGAITTDGVSSRIGGIVISGGGGRGGSNNRGNFGSGGGSGGGGRFNSSGGLGAAGIGNNGGTAPDNHGANGGGAGSAGSGRGGGAGLANSFTGSSVTYAAGGAGVIGTATGSAGAANTGNGGGGRAAGGSGVVVVRVKV